MSSKPSTIGVMRTITMLDELAKLEREIEELTPKAKRLEKAREELTRIDRELGEHLRSMDVESPGNYGWAGRFTWFAAELLRQARIGRES